MKYGLKLAVEDPKVFELLKPEIERFNKKRSRIKIKKREKTIIEIEANDAVALRATIDSVTQLLKVYERVGRVK